MTDTPDQNSPTPEQLKEEQFRAEFQVGGVDREMPAEDQLEQLYSYLDAHYETPDFTPPWKGGAGTYLMQAPMRRRPHKRHCHRHKPTLPRNSMTLKRVWRASGAISLVLTRCHPMPTSLILAGIHC